MTMTVAVKTGHAPQGWPQEYLLEPGENLRFGRPTPQLAVDVAVSDRADVSRDIGVITTADDHWLISNHTNRCLVVVSVDEGGAFIRVPPHRLDAPVPFEISRLLWPHKGGDLSLFEAFSMDTRFRDQPKAGATETVGHSWNKTSKHFLVLTALCEPQLRDEDSSDVPTIETLVTRLQGSPGYPDATTSSVNAQIEYLAVKCGKDPHAPDRVRFDTQKRQRIVRYAMRFALVQWEDLRALGDPPSDSPAEAGVRP